MASNVTDYRVLAMAAVTICVPIICAGNVLEADHESRFGLHKSEEFRITNGNCVDCPILPAALWYFKNETIAVPKQNSQDFERGARAFEDVKHWASAYSSSAGMKAPPLIWVGSPLVARGASFSNDGQTIMLAEGQKQAFALAPKIDSNRSYFDSSSLQHFAGRSLSIRGTFGAEAFIGRTLWPDDYALDFDKLTYHPLQAGESLDGLIRANAGGTRQPMTARILWQRHPNGTKAWSNKPVLALVLNGAQGDDDEALGGHFAIATGRFGTRGEWGDWIVNNFYNLDSVSEKGIIAASLPLDAYQGDLNSGQSWYRPSYFMVAVLKDERSAARVQQAISRVLNHYYRHDITYHHATANCTGLTMRSLHAVGWDIPYEGPTSRLKAIAALPYMSVKDMSLDSGKKAADYLMTERTDLYPMIAFEAAGNDLLGRLVSGKATTDMEKQMADDLEALIFIRIPQFPSSRAFGQAPVASIDEYISRAPADRTQWKIIPVPPRPFPVALQDPPFPDSEIHPSTWALAGYGGFFGLVSLGAWHRRKRKPSHRHPHKEPQ